MPNLRSSSILSFLILTAVTPAFSQTQRPSITATGQATVTANPDQAIIIVSVTTQAGSAVDASAANAVRTTNVISALKALIAASDDLRTTGYSLYPTYNNQGTITGYTVTNSIQVTIADLSSIGKLLDTATQAGATRVDTLTFGVKDPEPLRAQALKAAAAVALTQVQGIAAGLGVKLGSILAASDGSAVSMVRTIAGAAGSTPTTPIITGTVQMTGSVQVQVEIAQ